VHALRTLPSTPIVSLDAYEATGGGAGRAAARRLGGAAVVEHLLASGLRGRGGAGFPTGKKWSTVLRYASDIIPATVVVNAAEGEPGSFKDRALLRRAPYAVIEGALIAADAIGADRVVFALKQSFVHETTVMEHAVDEVRRAGWDEGVVLTVFDGPAEYLYGEETALLEAIDGRPPFPRISPPYRHGVEEVRADGSGEVLMADSVHETEAPPTLVDNVETLANVPGIMANGPSWFRELGTVESPGTIVCTVTGRTRRSGVGEFPMGTPLRQIVDELGGGAQAGRRVVAVMSGVANPLVTEDLLDTPASYEAMQAIGSGLGAAGFIVFDDTTDFAAVAHGVSRFLAVESCGQCTPCKQDGLALSQLLDRIRVSDAKELDLLAVDDHLRTITDGARCFLAQQHQRVVTSVMTCFPEHLHGHADGKLPGAELEPIAAIADLDDDGVAHLDPSQRDKQPDWTFGAVESGKTPVERLAAAEGHTDRPLVPPVSPPG
jgi:NADH-quinone oxidoreductase subunit F